MGGMKHKGEMETETERRKAKERTGRDRVQTGGRRIK